MADKVFVFFGPRKEFDRIVSEGTSNDAATAGFLDAIRIYNARIRASDLASHNTIRNLPDHIDSCIVHADDFGSVLSHVLASFSTILDNTFDIGTLYVQNPPKRAFDSILASHSESTVKVERYSYREISKDMLPEIYEMLQDAILGQEESKKTLIAGLYRLSVMQDDRPTVVLLYGPSGVGKTETARCLAEAMGGSLTRIQFSMMQTTEAYEYLFGAEHSKASFARDLLARESNVILIDEFDKVNPRLYNMFYQLFDEGKYVDTNYNVDMRNALFILTSNFPSEFAASKALEPAMFSRISVCVKFSDLQPVEKATIATRHYNKVIAMLDKEDRAVINASGILSWFTAHAGEYNNMRTMKNKIEKAVFLKLSTPIFTGVHDSPSSAGENTISSET